MKNNYSTRELAEILSVNESTVKRWADSGYIECVKTKGGHRKFPVRSVLRFIHENRINAPSISIAEIGERDVQAHLSAGFVEVLAPSLKEAALQGDSYEVLRILRAGLISQPDIILLFTQLVFPPLIEIGTAWENGQIGVDSEHLASQAIKSAIFRFQSEIHVKEPNGLSAVVSCFEGETHEIAATCVATYLVSEGWKVYHLGQDIPTEDLAAFIRVKKPGLVAISADIVENERRFVTSVNNKIVPAAKKSGARVVVGGAGIKARFSGRVKSDFLSEDISDIRDIQKNILKNKAEKTK